MSQCIVFSEFRGLDQNGYEEESRVGGTDVGLPHTRHFFELS